MLPHELFFPSSIAVVGASNDIHKPGGKVLANILAGSFDGTVYPVNPRTSPIQGLPALTHPADVPPVDVAILAIPAEAAVQAVTEMERTRNFIVLSAGFSESGDAGKEPEERLKAHIDHRRGCLIGPNSIGIMNSHYCGVFTEPVPRFDARGCHLITGSGATACFIMELAIPRGVRFSSVVSVGNSAQTGIEDVLAFLDETAAAHSNPHLILLYMERIDRPGLLLRHARSLSRKGWRIAAIKAGSSDAGSRAASSHTGAMASPDVFVDALFQKAGIIRCAGRQELVDAACALQTASHVGERFAVVTHAGGPGVMLTDALSKNGFDVPHLKGPRFSELLTRLHPGSSISNPIDFLATGTAEQLGHIIDTVGSEAVIDSIAVIFGTPGLVSIDDAYRVLDLKIRERRKPIFPVLPSTLTAHREMSEFISRGHAYFPDETAMAHALAQVARTPPAGPDVSISNRRHVFTRAGWLDTDHTGKLLSEFGIATAPYAVVDDADNVLSAVRRIGYPLAMKAEGILHKSDTGAVCLNIMTEGEALRMFDRLQKHTDRVVVQKMMTGTEIFCGAVYEPGWGHLVSVGPGGIFVEYMRDIQSALAPIDDNEAMGMIRRLRGRSLLKGARGRPAVDETALAQLIVRIGQLVSACDRIVELDLNPVMADGNRLIVVDARIRVVTPVSD
jgi:acetyltransferase